MKKFTFIIIAVVFGFSFNAYAQHLDYNLSKVAGTYGKFYLRPLADAFGADINSGLFHNASSQTKKFLGLNVYVGVKVFGAFIPNSAKTFSTVYNDKVYYEYGGLRYPVNGRVTVNNAPTIFGSETPGTAIIEIRDTIQAGGISYPVTDKRTEQTIGGIVNTNIAPLFIPQINVGSIYGTDLMIRWLPPIKIGDYGSVGFWGLGVRHNISQYFKLLPIDLSAQIALQNLSVKDSSNNEFISSNSFALNIEAGKSFSLFYIYGGLQYESASLDVNYLYNPPPNSNDPNPQPVKIKFSLDSKNTVRVLAGGALILGPLVLNLDYSVSTYNVLSAGLGFHF